MFKFSFSACWSCACLIALSCFSIAAFDASSHFACHAGPICDEIQGFGAMISGLEVDGANKDGVDGTPVERTGLDGKQSCKEEAMGG